MPLEGRHRIKARLDEINSTYQWIEVNGAHAFMRDEGYRYDPALAHRCYDLLLEVLHRRLALARNPALTQFESTEKPVGDTPG